MAVIGFIGSGNIGQVLARQAIAAGHDVVMSNSRGPHTLSQLIDALGPRARAATSEQAGATGDLVVVAIPFRSVPELPAQPLQEKIVIDANNYYPPRDGQVPAIDDGDSAASEVLAALLPGARVVKAFNAIKAAEIISHAHPSGTRRRRAIPIAGDDEEAKRVVTEFIDQIGFDVVDVGSLVDGRRIDPRDAWGPALDADALRTAVAARI